MEIFIILKFILIFSFCSIGVLPHPHTHNPSYEVVFQWKQFDYKLPPDLRSRLLSTRQFIPENNVFAGIKVHGPRVFLSVPRWRTGVPSTLNVVYLPESFHNAHRHMRPTSPLLEPYPNLEMQELGNCSALQYVQSMEIDEFGRMWVIDMGRSFIFTSSNNANQNSDAKCPAKLVIIDLATDQVLRIHNFPHDVVSPATNFLNDIVVGCRSRSRNQCTAYISDARDAKLVMYNWEQNRSGYVHHPSMNIDQNAIAINILGQNYTNLSTGINGIALSPKYSNHDRIYYTPLSSYTTYTLSTSVLGKSRNGKILKDDDVMTLQENRSSQCSALAMDSEGHLFYARLNDNGVVYISTCDISDHQDHSSTSLEEHIIAQNDEELQWPDTFAFDNKGYLYFNPNRNQRFATGTLDFNQVNFRVVRVFIGAKGYMHV